MSRHRTPAPVRLLAANVALAACVFIGASCNGTTSPDANTDPIDGPSTVVDPGGTEATVGSLRQSVTLALAQRDTVPYLGARGRVTNAGTKSIHLEYGACGLQLLAYRSESRSGTPVWSSDKRKLWNQGGGWACPLYLAMTDLAPGASIEPGEFALSVPLIEVLGDSLPDGRYWFSAQIRTNLNVATYLDAGAADLALPRAPLPTSRSSEVLRFLSEPVVVSGTPQQVTAQGRIRLDHAGGALVSFPRDCALRLHAYADRARRDAAPRSGTADWSQQRSCFAVMETITMSHGAERVFQTTVPAAEILGSSRPAGKYFFAVEILAQSDRVFLSAGEAELAR